MNPIFDLIILILVIYRFMILGVVILSWVNPDPFNPIVRFLRQATDPVLRPLRRLMWPLTQRIRLDLSPILAFLAIGVVERMIRNIQYGQVSAAALGLTLVDSILYFVGAVFIILGILAALRAVLDATQADPFNPIVRFITTVTDPIVYLFRDFRGRSPRFNFAPVAAALTFFVGYAIVLSLRTMLW